MDGGATEFEDFCDRASEPRAILKTAFATNSLPAPLNRCSKVDANRNVPVLRILIEIPISLLEHQGAFCPTRALSVLAWPMDQTPFQKSAITRPAAIIATRSK